MVLLLKQVCMVVVLKVELLLKVMVLVVTVVHKLLVVLVELDNLIQEHLDKVEKGFTLQMVTLVQEEEADTVVEDPILTVQVMMIEEVVEEVDTFTLLQLLQTIHQVVH